MASARGHQEKRLILSLSKDARSALQLTLAAALALFPALPTHAADLPGWDKTRWGMSSAEIAQAYGRDAVRLDGRVEFAHRYSDIALRRQPFAGYDFIVYFQMDERTGRLSQVLLERLKQYATAAVWQGVLATLGRELGAESARCDRTGRPLDGVPAVEERVWELPTTTVRASFLSFSAVSPERAPQDDGGLSRRILIRYAPTRPGAAACAAPAK
jgi:hypothetical protein